MAVQLDEIPQSYNFSDNPIICTFYSPSIWELGTTTEYFFKIEIYVGGTSGGGGSLHSTHYKKVENTYDDGANNRGYGRFDVSQILKTVTGIGSRTSAAIVSSASFQKWSIKVTAEYLQSGSPQTEPGSESSVRYVQKGSLTPSDYLNNRDGSGLSVGAQRITQYPSSENYYVALDEEVYFKYIGSNIDELNFKLYDASGVLIDSDSYTITTAYDVNQINASPQIIQDNTTLTSSDFASAFYYDVEVKVLGNVQNTVRFYIDSDCERFENVRLYFISRCGALEAYTFKMISTQRGQTKTNSAAQLWGAWGAEGAYSESLEIGGAYNSIIDTAETITIGTDWISEELHTWLIENVPVATYTVIEKGGVFQNVAITPTRYEYQTKKKQKLIRQEFTLNISNVNSGPRR